MSNLELQPSISPLLRLARRLIWLGAAAAVLLVCNYFSTQKLNDYAQDLIRQCGIAIIMAVSLNIVNGLTGQFSIGHAGFMAVGAYTGASVTYLAEMRYTQGHDPGLGWILAAMLAGGIVAALFGYIVGAPSLRLRGDYLAIVTLGFGEIIRVLIENSSEISHAFDYLGGATGFSGASGSYSVPRLSTFLIVFASVMALIVLVRNLKFSIHGLAFMSIREDEIAADAMGVNTTRVKILSFVLSAFFAGVGGVLFAHALFFQPLSFSFILSINYVIMVVLGGSGSITGATLAAVVLTALPELLKPVQERLQFGDAYRLVIYALLLVIMMILRPKGVFGMGELSLRGLSRLFTRGRSPITSLTEGLEAEAESALVGAGSTPLSGTEDKRAPSSQAQDRSKAQVVLEMVGLTRRFGGLTAAGDVNIQLRQGELVGLIGPNGAGKTTLFNLLTGVYEPSEGKIVFNGRPISGERPYTPVQRWLWISWDGLLAAIGGWIVATIVATAIVPFATNAHAQHLQFGIKAVLTLLAAGFTVITGARRRRNRPGMRPYQFALQGISRTFQNIRLFKELTVLENVRLATYVRRHTNLLDALFRSSRLEREEAHSVAKARELLAQFNLLRVENEIAKNLAYGDQRRLEIVRALATDPSLLLLDEPAAGMNPQEKSQLMNLIRHIRDEFQLTILLIEHDMKLVMGICERIYVLDYGRVIAEGAPQEIRSNPAVIAAYLGDEYATPQPSGASSC